MRVITTFLMAIGAIGVILFLCLITGYCLFSSTPSIKDQMSLMPVTYDAAQSFDQKLDTFKSEIKTAAAAGKEEEVTLTITEEEINSKMIELLAEGELPLKEILINFNDDLCWVYSVADNPGIDAKTGVIAQLDVIEDEIKITVIDFHLGKLPLPQSVDDRVGTLLGIMLKMQGPTDDLPVKITYIDIDDGQLIVEGVTEAAK